MDSVVCGSRRQNPQVSISSEDHRIVITSTILDGMTEDRLKLLRACMGRAFQDALLQVGSLPDDLAKRKADALFETDGFIQPPTPNTETSATITLMLEWGERGVMTADILHNGEAARIMLPDGSELGLHERHFEVNHKRRALDHFFHALTRGIRQRLFPNDTPRYQIRPDGGADYLGYPDQKPQLRNDHDPCADS